jgi:4-amino-4-deoxy-L-arabinose transferase-like glycosyltransferase
MRLLSLDDRSVWIDSLLLFAALLLLTFGIGQYGLFEPHEGHFAGVAREMVLRNDWVTPTLNGAPYLNKPPLLYWLIATSYRLFGIHEFAARLPMALAGWVGVVLVGFWSRQLWGIVAGRAAILLLSTSIGWFILAHQLLIDELLGTLLLGMMYSLWLLLRQPKSRWFFIATYTFLGLAILAKGLLAIAFWVTALAALCLSARQWQPLRVARPILGCGIVAAIVLPWFIAVERANPGFVQYFLFNENVKRALDTRWPPDYNISKISPWGYLLVVGIWCLPWVLLLPPAVMGVVRQWQAGASRTASRVNQQQRSAITLLGVLALLPILLFLPLSSRLYYYSIPALPPLAMMVSHWWATAWEGKSARSCVGVGWAMAALGVGITSSLVWLPQSIVRFFPELAQTSGVQTVVTVILVGLSVGFIGTGVCLVRQKMAIALLILWFGVGTSWACVIQGFKTIQDFRSSKTLVLGAKARLGANTTWIFEGSRELGAAGAMSFYLDPDGRSAQAMLEDKRPELSQGITMTAPQRNTPNASVDILTIMYQSEATYPTVYVLSNGGANRYPPSFPGPQPKMLITKAQMQTIWDSKQSVVFVTDFLRVPDDPNDPPTLNLPKQAGAPLLTIGPRQLYGNEIARDLWEVNGESAAHPSTARSLNKFG